MLTPLHAYAILWSMQIFEQSLLNGPGYVLKNQPLLGLLYGFHLFGAIKAARSGATQDIRRAHATSILLYLWRFPYMWDEDHWAVRIDVIVLLAILGIEATTTKEKAQATVVSITSEIAPYIMALFYAGSAFWKLNVQFFDPAGSCATIYFVTLLGLFAPESFLTGTEAGQTLLWLAANAAPTMTILVEMGIAVLLLAPPKSTLRRGGVFLSMLLHLLISIAPEPFNVSEYSIVCLVRMTMLLPDATCQALADWSAAPFATKLGAIGLSLASGAINLNPLGSSHAAA